MNTQVATRNGSGKKLFWFALGLVALSVFVFVDLPLLTTATDYSVRLAHELPVLVPHMICGLVALCIGPLQFSSRLRQGNVSRHRLLGKIYVCAILGGAIGGYVLVWGNFSPFGMAVDVLASLWIATTLMAFIAARRRRVTLHRQWMVRSYAVTFFFVVDRVPFEFPAFQPSEAANVCLILTLCVLAILIPDLVFAWSQISEAPAKPPVANGPVADFRGGRHPAGSAHPTDDGAR